MIWIAIIVAAVALWRCFYLERALVRHKKWIRKARIILGETHEIITNEIARIERKS